MCKSVSIGFRLFHHANCIDSSVNVLCDQLFSHKLPIATMRHTHITEYRLVYYLFMEPKYRSSWLVDCSLLCGLYFRNFPLVLCAVCTIVIRALFTFSRGRWTSEYVIMIVWIIFNIASSANTHSEAYCVWIMMLLLRVWEESYIYVLVHVL